MNIVQVMRCERGGVLGEIVTGSVNVREGGEGKARGVEGVDKTDGAEEPAR